MLAQLYDFIKNKYTYTQVARRVSNRYLDGVLVPRSIPKNKLCATCSATAGNGPGPIIVLYYILRYVLFLSLDLWIHKYLFIGPFMKILHI